jgi:hypothetical protein
MLQNNLYLAVLPLVHMASSRLVGFPAEQVMTLFPDKNFAKSFFPDEVEIYINLFRFGTGWSGRGHVVGYDFVAGPPLRSS